jgi:hypothetical protein
MVGRGRLSVLLSTVSCELAVGMCGLAVERQGWKSGHPYIPSLLEVEQSLCRAAKLYPKMRLFRQANEAEGGILPSLVVLEGERTTEGLSVWRKPTEHLRTQQVLAKDDEARLSKERLKAWSDGTA